MSIKAAKIIEEFNELQFEGGKKAILDILNETPDDLFCRDDIHRVLASYRPHTLDQYIEDLTRKGTIGKVRFKRKVYYGNREIIKQVKAKVEEKRKAKRDELSGKKK